MLNALAGELELQETLSFYLRDNISSSSRVDIADAHEYFRSAEAGFEFLTLDPQRCEAALRFLAQPLTLKSIAAFATGADFYRNREVLALEETLHRLLTKAEEEQRQNQRLSDYTNKIDKGTDFRSIFSKAVYKLAMYDDTDPIGFDGKRLRQESKGILDTFFTPSERNQLLPKLTGGLRSFAQAQEYLGTVQSQGLAAMHAALERKHNPEEAKKPFRKVFKTALKLLPDSRYQFSAIKNAMRGELHNLITTLPKDPFFKPLKDYVETLQAASSACTTSTALQGLISRADKNLDTRFSSLFSIQEENFTREIKRLEKRCAASEERKSLARAEMEAEKRKAHEAIKTLSDGLKEIDPDLNFKMPSKGARAGFGNY